MKLSENPEFQRLWASANNQRQSEYQSQRIANETLRLKLHWAKPTVDYAREKGWVKNPKPVEQRPIEDVAWWALAAFVKKEFT